MSILFAQPLTPVISLNTELFVIHCLSMESIRLGGPAHGIVTKTVHKTLPGGGGGPGGGWVGGGGGPGGG